jgi:signal transduction histidine kinase
MLAAALLSRRAAQLEFRRFELEEHAARTRGVAELVTRQLTRDRDPASIDSLLFGLAQSHGRDLLLIADDGAVLGASSPALRAASVTATPGGDLVIDRDVRRDGRLMRTSARIRGGPRAVLTGPDGSPLGTLVLLPQVPGQRAGPSAAFGVAFDLRLVAAAGVGVLVALALTWALSRRILGPIEALRRAAVKLGQGDLAQTVPVRSNDEIGELSRTFNAMAGSLARQETLRRTMVTDIAHELRTPLTNLRGQIEAVEDGLLPPSPATVRSLREEVLLLTRLVEDLQTLSIAEAGRLALDRSPTSVRELVERALEGFRIAAADGGVQLHHDVEELPRVDVDAGRVGQVLRNLLANAIRHTPPGGVVAVSARTEGDVVAVTVTDTGRGIDPDHLPHVFERFHRSDPSRSRTTGGAGLGLAIVKSLVEAHGGDVSASSAPGAGSAFRFTLPRVSR